MLLPLTEMNVSFRFWCWTRTVVHKISNKKLAEMKPVLVGQGIVLSVLTLCHPPWRRLNRSLRESHVTGIFVVAR